MFMRDEVFETSCKNMISKLLDPSQRLAELVTMELVSVLKDSLDKVLISAD